MPLTTLTVGAAVTPTVVKTGVSHYINRKPRHRKPTAHISYDEGLHLIRSFLDFSSHYTVEELQSFTSQWVPHPRWVKVDNVVIPQENISRAAEVLVKQLGSEGVLQVGGNKWWQWRQKGGTVLKGEWIEMRSHFNDRKKKNDKGTRVMLYVHGGGYFFGSVDEHRYQMQRHARKLRARVFAPRYRLAPQFPFPCGLQDCLATYLYLLTIQEPTEIILAGDSAGGGMIVSILCMLRDQGLPLPAGAVLISPWVDLTHSFPSLVGDNSFDYIPPHGFHQKPSASWPPPNDDEMAALREVSERRPGDRVTEQDAVQGFSVTDQSKMNGAKSGTPNEKEQRGSVVPGPSHQLSIEIHGKLVTLKDQIQIYTQNKLLSHPLVSPVLQPSLGGLPPLLVMTGGGELLRDEQIYLAHKAANPHKYPLGNAYRSQYDPGNEILNKYDPTPVQLQVWEDLCHVAPTLSFTRPAKFMYRSIAQFGAWALARAQKISIEIVDDDNISVISSGSDTDSEMAESTDSLAKQKLSDLDRPMRSDQIGKAGDPIPIFKNHMIRQRVNRHGAVFELAPAHELPATSLDRDQVGLVKQGPVLAWMEKKRDWDQRFAKNKRKVQSQRAKELLICNDGGFGPGERPPPSALAGRISRDQGIEAKRKSLGLAMWSLWGSKHDESTLKREEDMKDNDRRGSGNFKLARTPTAESVILGREVTRGARRRSFVAAAQDRSDRSMSRQRTVTVTDTGQAEGQYTSADGPTATNLASSPTTSITASETTHLSPMYIPKFKSHHSHLREGSKDDARSFTSSQSIPADTNDTASTTAVFAAPGVTTEMERPDADADADADAASPSVATTHPFSAAVAAGEARTVGGTESPSSRRSVERLMSNQTVPDEERGTVQQTARLHAFRSPSSVAVVGYPGVVDQVEGVE